MKYKIEKLNKVVEVEKDTAIYEIKEAIEKEIKESVELRELGNGQAILDDKGRLQFDVLDEDGKEIGKIIKVKELY